MKSWVSDMNWVMIDYICIFLISRKKRIVVYEWGEILEVSTGSSQGVQDNVGENLGKVAESNVNDTFQH